MMTSMMKMKTTTNDPDRLWHEHTPLELMVKFDMAREEVLSAIVAARAAVQEARNSEDNFGHT